MIVTYWWFKTCTECLRFTNELLFYDPWERVRLFSRLLQILIQILRIYSVFFSAVSVNPNDQPVIFHRGHVVWDAKSFGRDYKLVAPTLIGEDTIVTLDADSGKPLSSFGKDLFLMPHGLTVDNEGNIYVTDVGLHQVMRVSYFFNLQLREY